MRHSPCSGLLSFASVFVKCHLQGLTLVSEPERHPSSTSTRLLHYPPFSNTGFSCHPPAHKLFSSVGYTFCAIEIMTLPPADLVKGADDQQAQFSYQYINQQPFSVPPPTQQTPTQGHELRGQIQPQYIQGQNLVPQQANMNYQHTIRTPNQTPFYRPNAPTNMQRAQQYNPQMSGNSQPQTQATYPSGGIYMMPSNLGFSGPQIVIQPTQMQMHQSNRMSTPQYMPGMPSANTPTQYMNQTTVPNYWNTATIMYGPQQNTNMTPQNTQPAPPQKRERHILKIEDPVTHRDITSEVLKNNQPGSSRSTPPSGPGSGSRSTPIESASAPPMSDVAAVFAAQVSATLNPSKQQQPPPQSAPPHQSAPPTAPPDVTMAAKPQMADTMQPSSEETPAVNIAPPVDISQPPPSILESDSVSSNSQSETVSEEKTESLPQDTTSSLGAVEGVSHTQSLSNNEVLSSSISQPTEISAPDTEKLDSTSSEFVPTSVSVSEEITASEEVPKQQEQVEEQVCEESVSNAEINTRTSEESPETVVVETSVDNSSSDKPVESSVVEEATIIETQTEEEPTMEVTAKEVKKTKKKAKDFNKKELSGTDMDAFVDVASVPDVVPAVEPEPVVEDKPVPKVEIRIEDEAKPETTENIQENGLSDEEGSDDSKPVMELKYKYKEDQWSPLNPEGKRQYDREFILQLQYASESTVKPTGLPDLPDIILDKPHSMNTSSSRSSFSFPDMSSRSAGLFDFTPGYVKGSPRPGQSIPKRLSGAKGRGGSSQKIINLGSLSQDIQLHKADSAWKPARKSEKSVDEEDKKTEELYKKARGVLNKLTPQKFQTLVQQMAELKIDTEKRLKGVTDLVFEKAISEPGFSVAYANMCRYLTQIKVPSETKEGEYVNFRAILLTRCQKEFEKDKDSEAELEQKRKVIRELKDDEKSKEEELKAELAIAETKARRRQLGNIRFIGELFKLKMLTENIMHDCLFKLLRAKDEESLECLCRLLFTIGKELDTDKAKPRMDQYFNQMEKIVSEKKTSSRVRFMLQDVIELRLNKWIPRRDENNPKTLDQIHKEAQREEQERQIFLQQAQQQQKVQGGSRGGGPRGSRGGPAMSGSIGSSEGWNTVGKANIRADRQSIDPSKLKLSRQNVDESSIQLGPGGGASRFAGWGRGSTGGGARNSQEESKTPSNRFSALSKNEDENRSRFGVSPARGDSRGRGFGKPPGSRGITPRSSIEQEREKALAAVRDIATGQGAPRQGLSRDSSRESRRPEREPEKVAPPAVKQLTTDEMEKKTKSIMDEYLHLQDVKEAVLCVEELNSPSTIHVFVSTALNHVLERSEVARSQTGHLLHDLVKKGTISVDVYIKGLHEILLYAEDMEIDIPKIWQYFGELIGPMIQDGSVPLNFLRQAAEPLKENNKAGNLVAEVLHAASHREGHKKVSTLWRQSSLHWDEFVPADQIQAFLKDKENCDDKTMKSKKFIRALMTSVCQSAITGSGNNARVVPDEIKRRGVVLTKFLGNQAEFELQALYALQALVHKLEHPPGVLRTLFDTLYDEDIISEDAFNQWEKSTDPAEQEGKGVAMKQVVQFFTWLREAEDFSDS
ncbi:hypothetical protein FSP39_015996 [Pinctada imbricata]|uniref:Eukaryotic translation initiation factor 4 gamma 1-like n=1 Tax=Pinctada imbricata TaxID=66713 RepID=A0AA88YH55_PINIB|nr:hypothetical protein FSP39_015996 [Pinctada imbricata]